jgi:hypothetical protein
MDVLFPSCHAKHWMDERRRPSTFNSPIFEKCCKKGDVRLDNLVAPLEAL